MVTREQRALAKQQQILTAAVRLFAERGFDGTSTDAVSKLAGVSKETLYRYYPSKEQLLVAAMRQIAVEGTFTDPAVQLPDHATAQDLERVLCTLAEAVLDRILTSEYAAIARLVLAESGRRPELTETFRRLVPRAGAAGIMAILGDARQRGLLRADIELAAALRLFVGPLLLWAVAGMLDSANAEPRRPHGTEIAAVVRLFLRGVAPPA
jgi:TetR/AcrR family transcriptional regulator, mexJK operon transcriptional repressor